MNCQETTKTTRPNASPGLPSQSWLRNSMPNPAPSPKFGSSNAL